MKSESIERVNLLESSDGVTWKKVNNHFEDVLEYLLSGNKISSLDWSDQKYLCINDDGVVVVHDNIWSWNWTPTLSELKSEWKVLD